MDDLDRRVLELKRRIEELKAKLFPPKDNGKENER